MPKKITARAIPRTTPDATLVIRALMELSRQPIHDHDTGENTLLVSVSHEPELEDGDLEERLHIPLQGEFAGRPEMW